MAKTSRPEHSQRVGDPNDPNPAAPSDVRPGRWSISTRTTGEVLTTDIRGDGLRVMLFSKPSDQTAFEIEHQIATMFESAADHAATDRNPRAVPALLHFLVLALVELVEELERATEHTAGAVAFYSSSREVAFAHLRGGEPDIWSNEEPLAVTWNAIASESADAEADEIPAQAFSLFVRPDLNMRLQWSCLLGSAWPEGVVVDASWKGSGKPNVSVRSLDGDVLLAADPAESAPPEPRGSYFAGWFDDLIPDASGGAAPQTARPTPPGPRAPARPRAAAPGPAPSDLVIDRRVPAPVEPPDLREGPPRLPVETGMPRRPEPPQSLDEADDDEVFEATNAAIDEMARFGEIETLSRETPAEREEFEEFETPDDMESTSEIARFDELAGDDVDEPAEMTELDFDDTDDRAAPHVAPDITPAWTAEVPPVASPGARARVDDGARRVTASAHTTPAESAHSEPAAFEAEPFMGAMLDGEPSGAVQAAERGFVAAPVATRSVRRPTWPSHRPAARPTFDIRRHGRWGILLLVLFAVGWWVGTRPHSSERKHGTVSPALRALRAVGIGGALYTVRVTSEPEGASIAIDGKPTGLHTPSEIEVAVGERRVDLSFAESGNITFTVNGRRGEKVPLEAQLSGTLQILPSDVSVPVEVRLDGEPRGYAPVRVPGLAPGPHQLVFATSGQPPVSQTVRIPIRGDVEIVARSFDVPATGLMKVRATFTDEETQELKGANIWVDGERRGTTPLQLELSRGPHSIRAEYGDEVAPIQVIVLPGGNTRYATFAFGTDISAPSLVLQSAPTGAMSRSSPPTVSVAVRGLARSDLREMWLHVRSAEGVWRRYVMSLLPPSGGLVGVVVFPVALLDAQGVASYYVSALTTTGEEYFTEIQNTRPRARAPEAAPAKRVVRSTKPRVVPAEPPPTSEEVEPPTPPPADPSTPTTP